MQTLREPFHSATREIPTILAGQCQRFTKFAVVGIRVAIEIRNGFHRRPMPSTLTKKLERTIWSFPKSTPRTLE